MDLTMIDFILILGFVIICALIIAYFGLGVEIGELDDIDKVFKQKKRKRVDK